MVVDSVIRLGKGRGGVVVVPTAGCMMIIVTLRVLLGVGLGVGLDLCPRPGTIHGHRQRAPDGEQHGEQQQEGYAERLHRS